MIKSLFKIIGWAILVITLILVIWQPVVPSKYLIEGMTGAVEKNKASIEEPVTVRFDLSGKGGGVYNIVASKEKVEVIEGYDVDRVDSILYLKATDFNSLMIQMARGKADEFTMKSLVMGNFLDMAGDMFALGKLMGEETSEE